MLAQRQDDSTYVGPALGQPNLHTAEPLGGMQLGCVLLGCAQLG